MIIDDKIDIKSLTPEELKSLLKEIGQPAYRTDQVFSWLSSGCGSWDEMTNVPKGLREQLAVRCRLYAPETIRSLVSEQDGTEKYLWRLYDGNAVETVVISTLLSILSIPAVVWFSALLW